MSIPLVKRESQSTYNINIGEKVEGMIRHLCNRIPDKEWSGVLFYTVSGTFEEGLTVDCKDICLMDIGSATYTEFDTSPDIAGYMVDNGLIDCHMGLVHSHQSFGTFFSGTDTSTLQEEGSYKNNFVSLIVNNAGSYTAAITRHVYSEVQNNITFSYEMFGDGTKTGSEQGTEKREYIEYFMLKVNKPELESNVLDTRVNEILNKKRKDYTRSYVGASSWNTVTYEDGHWIGTTKHDKIEESSDKKIEDWRQMKIPWGELEVTKKETDVKLNKDALKVTLAKILTGSVTCNPYNIDVDSWIANYDKVYESKFSDLVSFSDWLGPYLEYLMCHIPGTPTDIIDDALVAVYADAIIAKIGKPKGKYSAELIDQLMYYGSC